jgi:HNH endonuclease
MENLLTTYTIHPAHYAKGKLAVHCKPDGTGWKTLAALIISDMPGVRYSNRESAYVVSPGCAAKFDRKMKEIQAYRELSAEAHATGKAVDHVDGDPTNNDPSNLRIVTLTGDQR